VSSLHVARFLEGLAVHVAPDAAPEKLPHALHFGPLEGVCQIVRETGQILNICANRGITHYYSRGVSAMRNAEIQAGIILEERFA